ncbi:MAG: glycosyltransferase family 9 protein [Flavobacteriaceae bacterium]|nr:glycosyltransferase family 9 protein [Flavobacteriaceae bacterium]
MKKILIIQNKRIGDVLLSSIIANNIKTVFPESEVHFFTYDYASAVLENNPNIDKIIMVKDKELKNPINLLKQSLAIRKAGYDIIFDAYSKFQSRIMCLLSGSEYRIGFKRKHKTLKLPFYTHPVNFLDKSSMSCGKAIEDRINIIDAVFPIKHADYTPKLFLTDAEQQYKKIDHLKKPVIMLGVLGSTPQKSMPYDYVADLVNHITTTYKANILFNYAPHQKSEALKIYEQCKDKDQIHLDIYENSVRGFIRLMNKCDILVANEGGSVHMAKALNKPTFTIYSPYILKDHWASFEDGTMHESIHLLEEKPELFDSTTREDRKAIEKNPTQLYRELTPELIIKKLDVFLKQHIKS